MTDLNSNCVEVTGRIHLGHELELVQKPSRTLSHSSTFQVGRPIGMPPVDYLPRRSSPGDLPAQRLDYSLTPTDAQVFIEDKGLVASYGIFGAPGSGKTNLLLYLLHQMLSMNADKPEMKYGALILDPKATLIDDVRQIVHLAGREADLVVINTDELNSRKESVNIINSGLDPYELGLQLVLAAQASGVATSDPYWLLAWGNLFGAACYLLSQEKDAVTIKKLMDSVLIKEKITGEKSAERPIQRLARLRHAELGNLPEDEQQDLLVAINQIENFFGQENDNIATIENIIFRAYSPFQFSRLRCYSPVESRALSRRKPSFYDQIIEEGKIVLVSLSPAEAMLAKTLSTLVKCLFQRSVLSRAERYRARKIHNFTRLLILACDEYSQVASEVPGQPSGDGDFFSLARQQRCGGLVATQSVDMLQSSSLKENWRAVFSTFGAKIFMRLADNETAEEATKLAGEMDWQLTSQGSSYSKDGLSTSSNTDLRERKTLPTPLLTQVFKKGDAVIIGSLDGSESQARLRFVHVPKNMNEVY